MLRFPPPDGFDEDEEVAWTEWMGRQMWFTSNP